MALTQDFTAPFKDLIGAWPMDSDALSEGWQTSAGFGEKLSAILIEAADSSTDLSTKWASETLAGMAELTRARDEPAAYVSALTDFASAQATGTVNHLAAFGEIARKAQGEALDLMMSTGKDLAEDLTAATATAAKAAEEAAPKPAPAPRKAAAAPVAKKPAAEPELPPETPAS